MEYDDREWRILTAQLMGTASGWSGRFRRPPLSRDEAIAELRAISDDPGVLADAAAIFVARQESWYGGNATQLLLDAGADPDLVGEYAQQRRERHARSFDLGVFAQALGQTR